MHINTFDHYQTISSRIHHLDPRVKVVGTILVILSNVLLPDAAWLAFLFSWGLVLLVSRVSRLRFSFLLTRSLVALPFALAAITAIFSVPGEPVFTLGIGSVNLTVTNAGLNRFASIMLRSWVSIQAAIVLTATTQFPDLVHAMRHLRVPNVLVATVSFMYRYLFVLSDETLRLLRAREARSARYPGSSHSGGSIFWRARIAGNMAGQLFLRSYERSERIYNAMLSRGYAGTLLTLNPHILTTTDWLAGSIFFLSLAAIQVVGHL
jgi:cobalt/nickel transport system permease protein